MEQGKPPTQGGCIALFGVLGTDPAGDQRIGSVQVHSITRGDKAGMTATAGMVGLDLMMSMWSWDSPPPHPPLPPRKGALGPNLMMNMRSLESSKAASIPPTTRMVVSNTEASYGLHTYTYPAIVGTS